MTYTSLIVMCFLQPFPKSCFSEIIGEQEGTP